MLKSPSYKELLEILESMEVHEFTYVRRQSTVKPQLQYGVHRFFVDLDDLRRLVKEWIAKRMDWEASHDTVRLWVDGEQDREPEPGRIS